MKVNFSKYEGAGNDFLLIDGRESYLSPKEIAYLCDRRQGVGADGVILLRESLVADFGMEIVNADGSYASMCGNGLRCLARFLEELGRSSPTHRIETPAGVLTTHLVEDGVEATMPKAIIYDWDIRVEGLTGAYLNTGVPHFVTFVDDVETAPLHLGPILRAHPLFGCEGVNVDFVQIIGSDSLTLRTYERGVEGETLACGTGAYAAALTLAHKQKGVKKINLFVRSGDRLVIDVDKPTMQGPAKRIFTGHATLPAPTMAGKTPTH